MSTSFDDVSFESTRSMTQVEFGAWVRARQRWDRNRYELMMGRVIMNPPAGYPHGEVEGALVETLRAFARAHGAGTVFGSSQGYDLPTGDTLEPDVSFISTERWLAGPKPEAGSFLRIVPDLVVEILSASTASRDRGEKKALYERAGVNEYWLVDWRARQIVVFVREGDRFGKEAIYGDGTSAVSKVLRGLTVAVADVIPALT